MHNGLALTRSCLNALLRQHLPDTEIIVVDDGSGAGEAAGLSAYADQVTVVRPSTAWVSPRRAMPGRPRREANT